MHMILNLRVIEPYLQQNTLMLIKLTKSLHTIFPVNLLRFYQLTLFLTLSDNLFIQCNFLNKLKEQDHRNIN